MLCSRLLVVGVCLDVFLMNAFLNHFQRFRSIRRPASLASDDVDDSDLNRLGSARRSRIESLPWVVPIALL
jgi:hypothetical protein